MHGIDIHLCSHMVVAGIPSRGLYRCVNPSAGYAAVWQHFQCIAMTPYVVTGLPGAPSCIKLGLAGI